MTTVLITSGTGLTGSRVARRLSADGYRTRIGSRSTEPTFDWTRPDTWHGALAATADSAPPEAVYLCYPSDIAAPGAADRIGAFAATAREHGVRRAVLLAPRAQSTARPAEDAVRDSGLDWTIVQAAWFTQNFTEGALAPWIDAGELPFPGGPADGPDAIGEPFVDADDLADVIVAAFGDDRYVGRTLEVTGPRLLTFGAAVAEVAAHTGRQIRYRPVTDAEFMSVLLDIGMPKDEATALTVGFAEILDGRNAHVTDDVERVLGRKPRDFSRVLAD